MIGIILILFFFMIILLVYGIYNIQTILTENNITILQLEDNATISDDIVTDILDDTDEDNKSITKIIEEDDTYTVCENNLESSTIIEWQPITKRKKKKRKRYKKHKNPFGKG